jgi:hypothetical protein
MLHQSQALSRAIKAREIISSVAFTTNLFNLVEVSLTPARGGDL